MDMVTTTMNMGMSSTVSAITATTSAGGANMGGMEMGGMPSDCKISMLWNWYTVDSCFLANSWHVRSNGAFAGTCIGVILLVIALEFLRRAQREYDAFIYGRWKRSAAVIERDDSEIDSSTNKQSFPTAHVSALASRRRGFRPTVLQQAIRSVLYMLQFAVGYLVMLLAMYYNGYVIICIFIGACLGAFIFHWDSFSQVTAEQKEACC